jgi:hypothetical protein
LLAYLHAIYNLKKEDNIRVVSLGTGRYVEEAPLNYT